MHLVKNKMPLSLVGLVLTILLLSYAFVNVHTNSAIKGPQLAEALQLSKQAAKAYFPSNTQAPNIETNQLTTFAENYIHQKSALTKPHKAVAPLVFKETYRKESAMGWHVNYQQGVMVGNNTFLPIYGANAKFNFNKAGKLLSVFDNTRHIKPEAKAKIKALQLTQLQEQILPTLIQKKLVNPDHIQQMLLPTKSGELYSIIVCNAYSKKLNHQYRIIFNLEGKELHRQDKHRYNATAQASGMVFLPDPLTSATATYGQAGFVDNNDADNPALNNQRVEVALEVSQVGSLYLLKNDYFEITNLTNPPTPVANSNTPVFNYTRSQSEFEDVNAFYHLENMRRYLADTLGVPVVVSQIKVDTHGANGDDISYYSYTNNVHTLNFGEGGVDDAEDADVIVHEFMHAVSSELCPGNCNNGNERKALEEGICDYFATSYSRKYSNYRWADMFTWDGHNEFWAGRNVNSSKTYPTDLNASYYDNSEIWSSFLMELWPLIGRKTTDALVLQSMYNFAANISMLDAAQILKTVDEELYNGQHLAIINEYLYVRGLSETQISAGPDIQLCYGDSTQLGINTASLPNGFTVNWVPDVYLNNSNIPNPTVKPNFNTEYVMSVHDNLANLIYRDTVKVNVQHCFNNEPVNSELQVLNTDLFYQAKADVTLAIPDNVEVLQVNLLSIDGRLLKNIPINLNDRYITVNGSQQLKAGMYLLHVATNDSETTFKLLKAQ